MRFCLVFLFGRCNIDVLFIIFLLCINVYTKYITKLKILDLLTIYDNDDDNDDDDNDDDNDNDNDDNDDDNDNDYNNKFMTKELKIVV